VQPVQPHLPAPRELRRRAASASSTTSRHEISRHEISSALSSSHSESTRCTPRRRTPSYPSPGAPQGPTRPRYSCPQQPPSTPPGLIICFLASRSIFHLTWTHPLSPQSQSHRVPYAPPAPGPRISLSPHPPLTHPSSRHPILPPVIRCCRPFPAPVSRILAPPGTRRPLHARTSRTAGPRCSGRRAASPAGSVQNRARRALLSCA
jgi:hypothetical protein